MADLNSLTPGTWNVDPSHSGLNFTVKHLMVSKVRGRFASFSGTLNIAADPLQSSVTAQADVASVTTGDTGRDEHLRSGDFFEAEKFPTISFASTKIETDGDDFVLYADLTIKGVTKNVKFELEFDGVGKDPWGNTYVIVIPGSGRDFDIVSYGADGQPGGEGENKDIVHGR